MSDTQNWPPGVRPAPVGSEFTTDPAVRITSEAAAAAAYYQQQIHQSYGQTGAARPTYSNQVQPIGQTGTNNAAMTDLTNRMSALLEKPDGSQLPVSSQYNTHYAYSSYTPQNYTPTSYTYSSQHYTDIQGVQSPTGNQDTAKASTMTTNSYQTISSFMPNTPHSNNSLTHMQYPESNLKQAAQTSGYQYSGQSTGYNQSYHPAATVDQTNQQQSQYSKQHYPQGYYDSSGHSQTLQSQTQEQYHQSQTSQQYPQGQTPQMKYQSQQPYSQQQQYQNQMMQQYPQQQNTAQYSQQTAGYPLAYNQQYANQTVPTTQATTPSSYGSNVLQSSDISGTYGSKTQVPVSVAQSAKQPAASPGNVTELGSTGKY